MRLIDKWHQQVELDRKSLEIPGTDDGDGPDVIYFHPVRAKEVDRILRKNPTLNSSALADLIIMKAEDKDGAKLFTLEDKMKLLDLPPDRLTFITNAMMESRTVEEHEKN